MADIASLVKALKDKAVAQYEKGAPYRQALASALKGDTQGINQALSKSELTPMDFATTFAPMGITAWHGSPHNFMKSDIIPSEYGVLGPGVYLAERLSTADKYGKNSYKYDIPDDLNLFDVYKAKSDDYKNLYKQNNIKFNPAVENYLKLGAPTNAFQAAQKDLGDFSKYGYEGIKGYSEFGGNEYAIFDPKKLKY